MYEKLDKKLNLPEVDRDMLKFWKDNEVFKKSGELKKRAPAFVFYEGPPGMNGLPHIGHTLTRIYKDTVLRYKSMRGYKVVRKAGWDTHGLPVELQAEKEAGLKNKTEIETYGVENFVNKCKEIVTRYRGEWEKVTEEAGFWLDFNDEYMTCKSDYIESVWWSLAQMFNKGLIYKGHKIVPYCPRCGTGLATHEVAQGYETVKDTTIFVRFKKRNEENTYFVAWTTTPWTLPSNVALAVNPDETYVKIKVSDEYYIVAEALAGKIFEEYETAETYRGKDLEFAEYEPIFAAPTDVDKKGWYVTCADFVTLSDGSGIVHIAPAFGADDYAVGQKYDLPFVQRVDERGNIRGVGEYEGKFAFEANKQIIKDLTARGAVVKKAEYEHEYPHCWRCHTPLLYYARNSWFIKMSAFREKLLSNNDQVNWMPESVKDGRMGNFLDNVMDWNLSRERYWATPLNIWQCEKCGHYHAVGSREELKKLSGITEDIELHRPWIDNVIIKCPECGGEAKRVPDVIDGWYDSGAMPFAQYHYPFENKDKFEEQFPADFICEGQDQTRGWFYSLQAISTVLFERTPYKNCMLVGVVLDKNGLKMSKSLGNVVAPHDMIEKYGADTLRWYFLSRSVPWVSASFNEDSLVEVLHKFVDTLWNTYAFYVLYANIDKFEGGTDPAACELSLMDRWILSELNTLVSDVNKLMDDFGFTEASRKIEEFVDRLSNWYVRRCRERFWVDGESGDKTAAFATLNRVLITLTKLAAPFMPFLAEKIYQNLGKSEGCLSVHLCDYPQVEEKMIDVGLQQQMREILDIVTLGRSVRAGTGLKTRQPLGNMYIHSVNGVELTKEMLDIIADDLNVKNIKFIDNAGEYIWFELKPQLKTLGPKYGKLLGGITKFLSESNGNELVEKFNRGESVKFDVQQTQVELGKDDVLVYPHSKPDFCADTGKGITVVMDTVLTPELIKEGHMREFVSKVQNMRKSAGLEVEDRIVLTYQTQCEELAEVIERFESEIAGVVLADKIERRDAEGFATSTDINGLACVVGILKAVK